MASIEQVLMPDGSEFRFWDDLTEYVKTYHVARKHQSASDDNPGTADRPFSTINKAAAVVSPGERVLIHEGTYRECVRPLRGGDGPDRMIWYQAVPGEEVRVLGSERWKPDLTLSAGWQVGSGSVWMADLPADWLRDYNPFAVLNLPQSEYSRSLTGNSMYEMQKRRGMVFAGGKPLTQVLICKELATVDGAFWIESPGRLHIRMWDDADPRGLSFEVTTREQIFAPRDLYLGYVRISGIRFEYGANGFPVPQCGLITARRGHHWIIEDCQVRSANSIGIDIGDQSWYAKRRPEGVEKGYHIIRRNMVSDCGVGGIAGYGAIDHSLVEDNFIENICGRDIEEIWDTCGIKFHVGDSVLIRRNVIRHTRHAPGIWLDYLNKNTRVTGNILADIEAKNGGLYLEVNHHKNMVDHNLLWDIRTPEHRHGLHVDSGENAIVAHNLFGRIQGGHAVGADLFQPDRVVNGRNGLCRRHRVLNNVFIDCPKRILFARTDENSSDGNLFDRKDDETSLCVEFPSPKSRVNLEGWQEHFGLDLHSAEGDVSGEFDIDKLVLTLILNDKLPTPVEVPELAYEEDETIGPFALVAGEQKWRFVQDVSLQSGGLEGEWVGSLWMRSLGRSERSQQTPDLVELSSDTMLTEIGK